jgi:hypothetical protein
VLGDLGRGDSDTARGRVHQHACPGARFDAAAAIGVSESYELQIEAMSPFPSRSPTVTVSRASVPRPTQPRASSLTRTLSSRSPAESSAAARRKAAALASKVTRPHWRVCVAPCPHVLHCCVSRLKVCRSTRKRCTAGS